MSKWRAHVAHMAKHVNTAEAPFCGGPWAGALAPQNPALAQAHLYIHHHNLPAVGSQVLHPYLSGNFQFKTREEKFPFIVQLHGVKNHHA